MQCKADSKENDSGIKSFLFLFFFLPFNIIKKVETVNVCVGIRTGLAQHIQCAEEQKTHLCLIEVLDPDAVHRGAQAAGAVGLD